MKHIIIKTHYKIKSKTQSPQSTINNKKKKMMIDNSEDFNMK